MTQFKFRLQKLLEYRQLQEKWAKDAYMEAVAKRNEAEHEIEAISKRKQDSLQCHPSALDSRLALDSYVTRLEDEIRAAEATREVLAGEAETAQQEWILAKQEAEAMAKLREADYEEWRLEQSRKEQNELDEWSVFRRAA